MSSRPRHDRPLADHSEAQPCPSKSASSCRRRLPIPSGRSWAMSGKTPGSPRRSGSTRSGPRITYWRAPRAGEHGRARAHDHRVRLRRRVRGPEFWVPPAGFEPATPGLGALPCASTSASMPDYNPILDDSSLRQDHRSPRFHSTNHSTRRDARTSPGQAAGGVRVGGAGRTPVSGTVAVDCPRSSTPSGVRPVAVAVLTTPPAFTSASVVV
jgi:hypothetical protein